MSNFKAPFKVDFDGFIVDANEDPVDMNDTDELLRLLNRPDSPQMSRRDMFAMAAMQGVMATERGALLTDKEVALESRNAADALITELDKTK